MVKLLNLMLLTEQDRYGFRFDENTFLVFNMLDVYDENVVFMWRKFRFSRRGA